MRTVARVEHNALKPALIYYHRCVLEYVDQPAFVLITEVLEEARPFTRSYFDISELWCAVASYILSCQPPPTRQRDRFPEIRRLPIVPFAPRVRRRGSDQSESPHRTVLPVAPRNND